MTHCEDRIATTNVKGFRELEGHDVVVASLEVRWMNRGL
jgi:hypothetical protein